MTVDAPKLLEGVIHENDQFIDHGRLLNLVGADIIISMKNPEITENPSTFLSQTNKHERRFGKLPSQRALTATEGGEHSCLSYITGVTEKARYLVNAGTDVSVLPANSDD
ncbi:unnamed protein product [Schistosoma margrebowiei]|uniref:Uncharacterized protein n=1 Tax=Schistosoma margrebowiei TaxID=48269 RepID=A0A183N976_9TREM|nr:unnamed protein product [Schistosoma margrebowiei]